MEKIIEVGTKCYHCMEKTDTYYNDGSCICGGCGAEKNPYREAVKYSLLGLTILFILFVGGVVVSLAFLLNWIYQWLG